MRATLLLGSFCLFSVVACGGGDKPAATSASPAPSSTTANPGDPSLAKPADHPDSDKVTWKKDLPGKACRTATAKVGADLGASLATMAPGCIDAKKMHRVGTTNNGTGQYVAGKMVTTIPLLAQANHCYRVIGLAEPTITDLDIAVTDSAGKSAGEDLNDSNDAIVLEDASICFKVDDAANVNVAVARGTGKWAVEVWSD